MNFTGKVLIFFVLFTFCSSVSQGVWWETPMAPSEKGQSQALDQGKGSGFNIGAWLVSIFRDHLSAVDSDRCPSVPSCSSYSVKAFKKHGFFVGWVMTVDRLIHEADEGSVSPVSYRNGQGRVIDPVENNDFWWFSPDEKNLQ
ncbi:MAG: membrane protein insertion efficiency factor YidD [Desulfatiglandaceae bacterium]